MTAPVYLSVSDFRTRTIIASAQVDVLEQAKPGFLAAKLDQRARWIEARLRKRYAVPFAAPIPVAVVGWLVAMVTKDALLALGTNAPDEQVQEIFKANDTAEAEIKEAADEQNGLFDLPLRDDKPESAIVEASPLASSQVSPFDWIDVESNALRGSS